MIIVTRLNGTSFAINADLIERMHANPDTTLVLVDGSTYIVAETPDEVLARIVEFRARVVARARDLPATSDRAVLGVVPSPADPPPARTGTVPFVPRENREGTWTPQR